ncbi:hypothetical protein FO519_000151 [Halicephalobus sp. NKZ332]|nr:hypothetical protein FO519_000151 [Halicephalobus sp. NKZ332]
MQFDKSQQSCSMVSSYGSGLSDGLRAVQTTFPATESQSRFERDTDEHCIFDWVSAAAASQPSYQEPTSTGTIAPIILARVPVRIGSTVVTLELQGQNCGYTNDINPPYCPQYESYILPQSVPQVPSVPSEPSYGYSVSPCQAAEFESVSYGQDCQQGKSVSELVDYLLSDDDGQPSTFEFGNSVFDCFDEIDPSFVEDLMATEPQEYQSHEQMIAYSSSSSSMSSSSSPPNSQSPVSQFVPIAPKPAIYQQPQVVESTVVEGSSKKRRTFHFSSAEEEYLVKRKLNNEASAKSRAKKRAKVEAIRSECTELEARNRELKDTVMELERQVATLKDILYSKIKQ